MAKAEPVKTATPAEKAKAKTLFVLDTTAMPDTIGPDGKTITGKRVHEQIIDGRVQSVTFEHGVAKELSEVVARKFLKHEAFLLTDKDGNPVAFTRRPKQPEELGAGEQIKLNDDETIARYDELSNNALLARVLEMPGGEKFAENPSRQAMIAYIVKAKQVIAEANKSKVADVGKDDFVPNLDDDEAEAA